MEDWKARLSAAPVRIQWDPERGPGLERLEHRSIQIGMSGEAVDRYVGQWITGIKDVTDLAVRIGAAVAAGRGDEVRHLLPAERAYPLTDELAAAAGASQARP